MSTVQNTIAVVVPTRGDRPQFIANCWRLIDSQTMQPVVKHIVDFPPVSDSVDITQRYRIGYNYISQNFDVDLIAFMEDDDWYSHDYLSILYQQWQLSGQTDLFGMNKTLYYNLAINKYFYFNHENRASMMNTFIKPGLQIDWCNDSEPYTDMHLWSTKNNLSKKVIPYIPGLCIGIKHGIGLVGGEFHRSRLFRYDTEDNGEFQATVDSISYDFYKSIASKLPSVSPELLTYEGDRAATLTNKI